jgi:hypothetical protein
MPRVSAFRHASVPSPAAAVYSLLADYRVGHPRILPPRYFPRLEVERGGVGAGTVIRFQVRLAGGTREVRAEITEPEPGRALVETEVGTGARTTFTVTPESGASCRVEIRTEWETPGLRGWVERLTVPPLLRRIYAAELARLAAICAAPPDTTSGPPGPPKGV